MVEEQENINQNVNLQEESIKIDIKQNFLGLYNVAFKIAKNYHLNYLDLIDELIKIYANKLIPYHHLQSLFEQVESQLTEYKITKEFIKEALAIIKIQDDEGNFNFEKNDSI